MIEVKFLADYRGLLTGELFHGAGDIVEFDNQAAEKLVEAGRAQYLKEAPKAVDPYAVEEKVEKERPPPKAKRKAKKKAKK